MISVSSLRLNAADDCVQKRGFGEKTSSFSRIWIHTLIAFVVATGSALAAENLTVPQAVEQQAKWPQWTRSRTVLHISGRYEGRAGAQFRLEKLPILSTPARGVVLANDIQAGQRLTVTGTLREAGRKYYLDVTRINIGRTDGDTLADRARELGNDKPEALYDLADEFQSIADFYIDKSLAAQVQNLRLKAFGLQRQQRSNDPAGLLQLADAGAQLGVPKSTTEAIRFESLVVRSKARTGDRAALMKDLQSRLTGWDRRNPFPDKNAEARFLKDMVAEYEKADDLNRLRMHRRFYQNVRSADILKNLKADGSNGLEIAATLTADVPEEKTEIARVQSMYVAYRLKRVPSMTRSQLEDVESLLRQSGRSAEFSATLQTWLKAQEERLNNEQLDGMLLLADQYMFAFQRWKNKAHGNAGTDLLKKSWHIAEKAAPKEAAAILEQLEKFGWTRLGDRWMTTREMKSLPRDDVALALRESRVVAGMTREQIVSVMGIPDRRVRVVSGRSVQEIWLYGESGSSRITVHLERSRYEKPEDAVAILVSTGS